MDLRFGDNQQLADRYDRWATQYDADHDGWEWIGPAKAVEQLRALGTMSTVLDAGCGTGRVGVELAATGWDGTLVGVDLSAGMLAVAAETAYYERLVQASLTELPLEDGSVDAVIATESSRTATSDPKRSRRCFEWCGRVGGWSSPAAVRSGPSLNQPPPITRQPVVGRCTSARRRNRSTRARTSRTINCSRW